MLIDYHVHTELSWDAHGKIAEYCRRALDLGLDEIGFTEHLDLDPSDRAYGFHDFRKIDNEIRYAREMFGSSLSIKKGIEVTYQEEFKSQIDGIIGKWDYDYVLGAIHFTSGVDYTSPSIVDYYLSEPDKRKAFGNYFDELLRAIKSRLIDIVAHIDVIKRHSVGVYGQFDPLEFKDEFDEILVEIVKRDLTLEINSGDIANRGGKELYPSDWILKRYFEMGGRKITYGSDAHKPEALSGGYEIAVGAAKRLKFDTWTIFTKRESQTVLF